MRPATRRCLFELSQLALTSMSRKPATTLGCPRPPAAGHPGGAVSVVGNEARRRHSGETEGWRGIERRTLVRSLRGAAAPRRVDADSSGARDGVARLSKRPLRVVELRLSEERVSATRAVARRGDIRTPEPRRPVTRPNESGCRFVAYLYHFAAKTLGTGGKNRILGGRR